VTDGYWDSDLCVIIASEAKVEQGQGREEEQRPPPCYHLHGEQRGCYHLRRLTASTAPAARHLVAAQWGSDEEMRVFGREENMKLDRMEGLPAFFVMRDAAEMVVALAKLSRADSRSETAVATSVVVHPRRRRMGIGKCLMELLALEVARASLTCIYLRTPDMALFYEACGYQIAEKGVHCAFSLLWLASPGITSIGCSSALQSHSRQCVPKPSSAVS